MSSNGCNTANNNVCQDGSSAAGGVIVEDEGIVRLNPATTINFIGAGVTAVDAGGGVADVTIPGGGVASFRLAFTDVDLAAGVLPVNHALAQSFNTLAVYDDNNNLIQADEVTDVDANNIDVDLSTFQVAGGGAIQNTWNVVVIA